MVAKSDLQFAGEFLVEECQIVSTTGQVYDINSLVEEINVFENIYTAAVSGDIVIKDTTNIVQNFPIIGEEKLILKIQTPQAKPEPETTIDFTLSPLIIYKINSQYGEGENAQIISLQFGSMEGFRNTTSRVSQSYSGQPNEIVEKILRDENYLKSKKTFYFEPTANNAKIIFPNIRPFKCIKHLSNISNSQLNNASPSYLFYETTKGFHFRTYDSMCREDPKLFLKENVGASLNEKGVIDAQKNLDTLINYQRVSSKDTVKNLNSGMISSKLIKHDVYHKRLDLYKYNYLDNFDRDIHPDNGEATPIISTAKDPDTNKSLIDNEDTKLFVVSTASGYSFEESGNYPYQSDNLEQTLQRKTARRQQFENGHILNIEVNGQTFIQAGDKINLEIGATSALTQDKEDKQISGNYIITHLRHTFTKSQQLKHKIVMQVAKDSGKSNVLPSDGIPQNNQLGPDRNHSKSIDVSAGHSVDQGYVDGVI
tara:strand:- start:53 stop:1501 length:1449 start_codon:yes stop_codon:yes gene_type:complete